MVLQGDEAQLEACFGPFGDSANLDVRSVHGLRRTYHRLGNYLRHLMVLLGDEAQVQAHFGLFRDSTSFIQDRCTVCVERIIGSENRFGRTRWNS